MIPTGSPAMVCGESGSRSLMVISAGPAGGVVAAGHQAGPSPVWTRRELMDGVRWRTRAGAPWRDVPERYGSSSRAGWIHPFARGMPILAVAYGCSSVGERAVGVDRVLVGALFDDSALVHGKDVVGEPGVLQLVGYDARHAVRGQASDLGEHPVRAAGVRLRGGFFVRAAGRRRGRGGR